MNFHILIADDDEENRILLEHTIGRINPEYKVNTATNAQDTIDYLTQNRPSLIISDLDMPGLPNDSNPRHGGYDVIQKARDLYQDVPVYLWTSNQSKEVADNAKSLGCREVIEKTDISGLVAVIRKLSEGN